MDNPIVEVTASPLADIGKIRLKFLGLPGDSGPELFMDETLARATIIELSKCLPENAMRPKIVCLCGSTRFYHEYMVQQLEQTLKGNIVLSVGAFMNADPFWIAETYRSTKATLSDKQKTALDELHLRKIDMADEVFIINPGGYIGNSTLAEIAYAIGKDKIVNSLEPLKV